MAKLLDQPKLRSRNRAYSRAQQVRDALVALKCGGTAADVRAAVLESTNSSVGLDAIKASLWHLESLGVVSFSVDRGSRWWKLAPAKGKS